MGDIERCKLDMLQYWLDNTVNASWKEVARALEQTDQLVLATTVKKKHMWLTIGDKGGGTAQVAEESNAPSTLQASTAKTISPPHSIAPFSSAVSDEIEAEVKVDIAVVEDLQGLESLFSHTLVKVKRYLQINCDLSDAQLFLDTFLSDGDFSKCDSFDKLIRQLDRDYIDIFNTFRLRKLVACFEKDELNELVEAYEEKKRNFLKNTTVLSFQRAVVSRVEPVLPRGKAVVTIRIPKEMASRRTLKDIEELAKKGFEECYKSLIRLQVVTGSVIISWIFPVALSAELQHLVCDNLTIFKDAGVEEVTIDGKIVFSCAYQKDISALSQVEDKSTLKQVYTQFYHQLVDAVSDLSACQSLTGQLHSTTLISQEKIVQLSSSQTSGSEFLKVLGVEEEPHLLTVLMEKMAGVKPLQTLAGLMSAHLSELKQGDLGGVDSKHSIEQQQLESRINQLISDKNEMHTQLQDCEEKIKSQNELLILREKVISGMLATANRKESTNELPNAHDHLFVDPNLMLSNDQAKDIKEDEKEVEEEEEEREVLDKEEEEEEAGVMSPSPPVHGRFQLSGVEESIGWGFMSPSTYEQQLAEYVSKPGGAAPSKSRWQGFKLSLRDEKKAQSIFNPKNKKKLIKYLVNPKVDVNATNDSGQTVLHSYVHSDRPDKLELLVTLLSHCNSKLLQIDKVDRYGNSALLVAVEMNDLPSVKALLAFGANINCQNTFGETPIDRVVKQYQYGNRDELHELLSHLHAVPGKGMPSPSAMQEPLNKSINSIVNESYEIVEDQQLGVYLEPKRLTAFVFKLEEMMRRQNLEYSVSTNLSIPPGFQDHNRTFFDPMIARESQLLRISEWKSTLDFNLGAGSRMLILDGGGIRALIQIEILEKIEKLTGRRIVELFDWIIGTSTGGIIALALVYLGISLPELRQLYFRMREEVLCGGLMSVSKKTDALEHLLRSTFGNMNMRDKEYPKVMIGAVSTKQNPPLLHFFNNCFNDEFSGHLVWKVARYTSAGPGYFNECDRYMDGGVLANNPSLAAWTDINTYCRATHTPPPRIAMVVSLGTGVYPPEQMGSTDILGKGRFLDLTGTLRRVQRFIKMMATTLTESDKVAVTFKATCDAAGIKFFRLSPTLSSVIPPDEIDPQVVVDMIMLTKEFLGIQSTQRSLDEIVKLFRHITDISRGLNLEK